MGHQDKDYDWHNFDFDAEVAQADKAGIDAPRRYDLSGFKAHGGKLLLYHGWYDSTIPPEHTVMYYESRCWRRWAKKQDDWLRLYMEPGMAHCGGGIGPDQFNKMGVIERWREAGQAPEACSCLPYATGGSVDMTRPLCPYPQVAVYKSIGSTNDAANFSCKLQ